jgi:hypothetical protein
MKRKFLVRTLLVLLAAIVAAMFWQQSRYTDIRRDFAQDLQSSLHGQSLHVLTFLKAPLEGELLSALRTLRTSAEREGSSLLIYAGKVVQNGRDSTQLTQAFGRKIEWDAIILQQFESREAYSDYLQDDDVQAALAVFPDRFAHGMSRSAALNLLLPQVLLFRKVQRLVTFAPSIVPFEPAAGNGNLVFPAGDVSDAEALVVVNLMLDGDAEQRAANSDYDNQMFSLMAEQQHGPIHVGASVPIDHPVDYTSVALVYYPGARYFRELLSSAFFQRIIGDKQLADTMISITVPITNQL